MNDFVTVRNTLNGGVARVRRRIAEHAVFGLDLEIVPDGTKPSIPLTKIVEDSRPTKPEPEEVEDFETEEDDD